MQILIYAVIIVSLFLITLSVAGAQEQPLKGGFDYYGVWHRETDQSKVVQPPAKQGSTKNKPHHAHPRCRENAAGQWVCKR